MRSKKALVTAMAVIISMTMCGITAAAKSDDDEIKVRRVEIAETATVRVNQIRTLSAFVTPSDADDKTLDWASSNREIVAVEGDGIIIGISPGTAEITATSQNGRVGRCIVTVPRTAITSDAFIPDILNTDRMESATTGGERLYAAALHVAVEEAIKSTPKNGTALVTYQDKTTVSSAALRGAQFIADQNGREVKIRFRTPSDGGAVQGQITVDPANTPSEDMDIKVGVHTTGTKAEAAKKRAQSYFESDTTVIVLDQQGDYGMEVAVAAKAELPNDIKMEHLSIYRRDGSVYVLVDNNNLGIDSNGYLHFITLRGGEYAIACNR